MPISKSFNTSASYHSLTLDDRANFYTEQAYHTSSVLSDTRLSDGRDVVWGAVRTGDAQDISRMTLTYVARDGLQRTLGIQKLQDFENPSRYEFTLDGTKIDGSSSIRGIHPSQMPSTAQGRTALFAEAYDVARNALTGNVGNEIRNAAPALADDVNDMTGNIQYLQRRMQTDAAPRMSPATALPVSP